MEDRTMSRRVRQELLCAVQRVVFANSEVHSPVKGVLVHVECDVLKACLIGRQERPAQVHVHALAETLRRSRLVVGPVGRSSHAG
eukprot:3465157-Prorocentrum_lima.AAC.1